MMFRPVTGTASVQASASFVSPARHRRRLGTSFLGLLTSLVLASQAADYYVAPTATSTGTGTAANPWTLATALAHPAAVRPGDTIWLKGGTYTGVFNSTLTGSSTAPIKVRVMAGEQAVLDNKMIDVYKPTLNVAGSYAWYWGLEILNSSGKRVSTQSGSWPTDIPHNGGIVTANSGTGNRFINLLVHDCPFGIGLWNGASNIDAYGCVVFYNGWKGPDRPHGHGVYAQNTAPSIKKVQDCFLFYNADHGAQFYGTTTAPIDNFDVSGNVIFNNSDLFAGTTSGRNLLVGGGAIVRNPIVASNALYRTPANFGLRSSDFYLGYGTGSDNALVRGNYMVGSAQFSGSNDTNLTCDSNLFYGPITALDKTRYPNNTFTTTRPTGTRIMVRPNQYEPGRANLAIYNWDKLASVPVSVTGLLVAGDTYELRNVMNYHGDIITGTYTGGGTISVPMTGRTVAAPIGIAAPASPFPEFGAFVLLRKTGGTPPANTSPTISTILGQTIGVSSSTGPLGFSVGDAETAATSLTVTAGSSNTSLVPATGLVLGGTGNARTVTVTPAAGQVGTATITLTVSDGSLTASSSFTVTVVNTPPTISTIASQTINAGTSTGPLAFSVGDAQTAAGSLAVTAASSNGSLVPTTGLVLGGTGSARTVTVTPAPGQTGSATITLTVSDGLATASSSFTLTVNAVNTAPTISAIANRTIAAGTSTGPIGFTVADAETAAGSLAVTASSGNTTLVPATGLSLGGTGSARTLTVTPAPGQAGTAVITVRVSDGVLSASTMFSVTVTGVTGAKPTIAAIADQVIIAGGSSGPIGFTIGDPDTPLEDLTVSYRVSNPALLPTGTVVLGGTGANRSITITPASAEESTTSVLVTVSDGTTSASSSFAVTVTGTAKWVYLPLEAEQALLVAPMTVQSNAQASGQAVISSPTKDTGTATFNLNIPVDGEYMVWCRLLSPDASHDSFYVSVDGGAPDVFDTAENAWSPAFQWSPLNGRNGGQVLSLNPRVLVLKKGPHTLQFQARDPGTILDRILITNDRQIAVGDY